MSPAEKAAAAIEDYKVNIAFVESRDELVREIQAEQAISRDRLNSFLGAFSLFLALDMLSPEEDDTQPIARRIESQLRFIDFETGVNQTKSSKGTAATPEATAIAAELDCLHRVGLDELQAATHYLGARLLERFPVQLVSHDGSAELVQLELGVALGS